MSTWDEYYKVTSGREPRKLFKKAFTLLDPDLPKIGCDIGFGAGNEVLFLLDQGWSVTAIDSEEIAGNILKERTNSNSHLDIIIDSYENVAFEKNSLIHAGYSLPFCHPQHFDKVWYNVSVSLYPGGIFCGQLFGVNDAWKDDKEMIFHSRDQIIKLLQDFEILHIEELEGDRGTATGGQKYWHTFDIIARK